VVQLLAHWGVTAVAQENTVDVRATVDGVLVVHLITDNPAGLRERLSGLPET
jgi:hypothetical protein